MSDLHDDIDAADEPVAPDAAEAVEVQDEEDEDANPVAEMIEIDEDDDDEEDIEAENEALWQALVEPEMWAAAAADPVHLPDADNNAGAAAGDAVGNAAPAAALPPHDDLDPLGPVYVIQGFGPVGGGGGGGNGDDDDDDDDGDIDLADGLLANFEPMVQNELQVMFDEVDALHSFYQPLLGLPSGLAALGGKFGRHHRCHRPVQSLLKMSMDKYLRHADVAAADRVLGAEMPKTLFYELLQAAMSSRESRATIINLLLKHWPERTLRVSELKRCATQQQQQLLNASHPFSPCASEKALLAAFFSAFGNTQRENLRCLDLRGANERFLEKLEEFQGFYTDPFFRDSDYSIILPIRYVYRRAYALDYILHDWLKVLRKSPTFFKVASLTMDFTKNNEMDIMSFMTVEFLDSFHLGRYKLFRDDEAPPPMLHHHHHFPAQQQQSNGNSEEQSHSSPSALKWRSSLAQLTNLTSLTISAMSTISPLRKLADKSACAPDGDLIDSWNAIMRGMKKLRRLNVHYQTFNGTLGRLLAGVDDVKLVSLSLDGSVLNDEDLEFLQNFVRRQKKTLTKVHLGIWNFKDKVERVMRVLSELSEVNSLTLRTTGRIEQAEQRRVPRDCMRQLATCLRKSLRELRLLHLCDFNLETPGLVIELIDALVPSSGLVTLIIPTRVIRTLEDGSAVPFLGDLGRLGGNSKYKPYVDAYKKHLSGVELKNFSAKATNEGIRFSTGRQQGRLAFALR